MFSLYFEKGRSLSSDVSLGPSQSLNPDSRLPLLVSSFPQSKPTPSSIQLNYQARPNHRDILLMKMKRKNGSSSRGIQRKQMQFAINRSIRMGIHGTNIQLAIINGDFNLPLFSFTLYCYSTTTTTGCCCPWQESDSIQFAEEVAGVIRKTIAKALAI